MARTPARVFAYVLADDAERYTAGELAAGLRVSPAAISGAVRTLVQAGLLGKEREPGSRSESYRVYDDVWAAIVSQRLPMMDRWEQRLVEETREFVAFWRGEVVGALRRWQERR